MQKKLRLGVGRVMLLFTASLLAVLFTAYQNPPQPAAAIILQNEPQPLEADTYAITGIADERTDAAAVAWLIPDGAAGTTAIEKTNLQGGTVNALRKFIARNVLNGNKKRSIIVGIRQLRVIETLLPDRRIDGRVTTELSFGIQRGNDTVHLIDYKGGMHYIRPRGNRMVIEPGLRRSLVNGLAYFSNWMKQEADHNLQLATAVHLNIMDYSEPVEGDTIYYSPSRPLRWDDFRDKPYGSRYAASVFPGFGFDLHQKLTNGVVKVNMAIKVYVPKSACWVKNYSRTPAALSHEQLHFDIVKIISERYKRQLLQTSLPVEEYDGVIHAAYYKFYHQMNVMQEDYDNETRHGQDAAAQLGWERKIKDELNIYLNTKV